MKNHPLKIVRIEAEDVLFDPEEASRMLTEACRRNGIRRFAAGCLICKNGHTTGAGLPII